MWLEASGPLVMQIEPPSKNQPPPLRITIAPSFVSGLKVDPSPHPCTHCSKTWLSDSLPSPALFFPLYFSNCTPDTVSDVPIYWFFIVKNKAFIMKALVIFNGDRQWGASFFPPFASVVRHYPFEKGQA